MRWPLMIDVASDARVGGRLEASAPDAIHRPVERRGSVNDGLEPVSDAAMAALEPVAGRTSIERTIAGMFDA